MGRRWFTMLSFLLPCASCLKCYSGSSSFGETSVTTISCQERRQCVKVVDAAGAASYGCDEEDECGRALEYPGKIVCPPSGHVAHGRTCCCETDLCNWTTRKTPNVLLLLLVVIMLFIRSLIADSVWIV